MIGTLINAAAIVLCGGIALASRRQPSTKLQEAIKGLLGVVGAIQDGLADKWQALAIKAVMDGLTTVAFVATFRGSVIFAVIPVVAFQGILSLGAKYISIQLLNAGLINSINATGGLLVF